MTEISLCNFKTIVKVGFEIYINIKFFGSIYAHFFKKFRGFCFEVFLYTFVSLSCALMDYYETAT